MFLMVLLPITVREITEAHARFDGLKTPSTDEFQWLRRSYTPGTHADIAVSSRSRRQAFNR